MTLLAGAFSVIFAIYHTRNNHYSLLAERLSMREVENKWANPSEDDMRRIFRLWRMSRNDLRLLWQALRHPNRPTWLLPATLALGFFALEPFNFAIPVLGVVDDLFLLPLLLHGLAKIAVYATTLPSTRSRDDRVVSVQ
jgi:uncharacterized membrane protein YkvA (DUF1232 family)